MKFRMWISLITIVLVAGVIVAAWDEIKEAFKYLTQINLLVISLMIPAQFLSYWATGEMIFSYLRKKGQIKDLGPLKLARMSLELNFVNHVFPSGGAAGTAYFSWLLGKYGVSPGRSTMAQIVRFALTFATFIMLLLISLLILIIDKQVDRTIVMISLSLVALAIIGGSVVLYLINSRARMDKFSAWLTKVVNNFVRFVTRKKKNEVVKEGVIGGFFGDIHDDYEAIKKDKLILTKPFLWATLANILDVVLIYIAFWSFGYHVNPAIIFIAFGLSSIAGALVVTPAGAGVYEAVMIAFLSTAGVPPDVAIAGTLLARVLLMLMTAGFGYVSYQATIVRYGKAKVKR